MALQFMAAFASQKVKDAAKSATAALVAFDPKGATEAQISLMDGQLDELGKKVAGTQRQYGDAKDHLAAAMRLNAQRLSAAESLQSQITAGDASKQASLDKLLDIIEQAQPELNQFKEDESDVASYLSELQTAYNAAAAKLATARHDLGQASRGMDRAKLEEQRARERADASSVTVGIHNGGDTLNTALDAMKRKTAEAQDAAHAANLKASTLAPQDSEKEDPAIAAAMATASGEPAKPQTAAERLAILQGRAA
jgi:chromosome segregation ATPase